MSLRALVLDFGGVVIKTPFEVLPSLERRIGAPAGSLAWYGPFAPERDELWRKMQRHEITERDYWALRAEEAGRLAGAQIPWTPFELMPVVFGGSENEFIRPEAAQTIAAVRDAGLKVAVLTNDLAAFHGSEWYEALAISKDIERLVDASLTGNLKPDPKAYAQILEELDVLPHEALFVDDQPRNVAGAERAGMQTVAFDVTRPAESFDAVLRRFGLFTERVGSSC
jgi:putative hydrolase of the HAD superfamily